MARSHFIRLLAIALPILVGACFGEEAENFRDEELIIENTALGQQEADDALEVVYQAEVIQKLFPGQNVIVNGCAIISDDPVNKILTIDFGANDSCVVFFGRERRGKIFGAYSAIGDTLGNRTLTFEDYSANRKKVEGTVALEDLVMQGNDKIRGQRSMTDLKIIFPDGSSVTLSGSQERTWTSGLGDTIEFNNTYSVTGGLTGVSSTGHAFTSQTSGSILINFFCANSSTGYARTFGNAEIVTLDGYPARTRTINYGDSTCDNSVNITTFRRSYGVTAD